MLICHIHTPIGPKLAVTFPRIRYEPYLNSDKVQIDLNFQGNFRGSQAKNVFCANHCCLWFMPRKGFWFWNFASLCIIQQVNSVRWSNANRLLFISIWPPAYLQCWIRSFSRLHCYEIKFKGEMKCFFFFHCIF